MSGYATCRSGNSSESLSQTTHHHSMALSPATLDAFELQRAKDEYALMDIAIGLDAAIRVYMQRKGAVNLDVFLDKLDEQLVRFPIMVHSSLLIQIL